MKETRKNKLICLLATLLLTIPSIVPLVHPGFFTFHDETQIANLHQFIKVMDLGQFPPRWAPDMHFTYGSPYPEFNYQLPYYLGYLIKHLGFTLVDTYKIILLISVVVGALGMYILGLTMATPVYALAASVLYTYTPYRAVDIYVRGTIGESAAIALFPWLFHYLFRILRHNMNRDVFLSSIFCALLIITHQPATVFVAPVIFGIVFLTAAMEKNTRAIKKLLAVPILSAGLSAFYLLPVILEQHFIQKVAPFNFYDQFPFVKQLIYSAWGYGSSHWGPDDQMSFQIGAFNLLFVAVGIFTIFRSKTWKVRQNNFYLFLLFALLFFFATIFLMNTRSAFLWQIFPFTDSIQFPWRLLMSTTFLTTLIFLLVSSTPMFVKRPILALLIALSIIAVNIHYFQVGERVNRNDDYYLRRYLPNQIIHSNENVSSEYLDYTENYYPLPLNAIRPDSMPTSKIEVPLPGALVTQIRENPLDYLVLTTTPSNTTATFNSFYYPGWKILVDGQNTPVFLSQIGAISFTIPQGTHQIRAIYADTPLRRYANIISLISIVITAISFVAHTKSNATISLCHKPRKLI